MKIAKALIENYRQIERLELNFTGTSGDPQDLIILAGPNGSGKSTVLDALAAALGPVTDIPSQRPGFVLTKPSIVRSGADFAQVTCWLRFTDDEIAAVRELYKHMGDETAIPDAREIKVTWRYPDPDHRSSYGVWESDPADGLALLKGRVRVAKLLPSKKVNWDWFKRVGGIFTFDQQRTGTGKTIRQDLWNVINAAAAAENDEPVPSLRRASDPRTILLSLALKSLRPIPELPNLDEFKLIQEHFAELCSPRKLLGAGRDEFDTPDLRFTDGVYEYGYDGLGAGEEMVLLFLVRLASEHVNRSIVLIDEIELHQRKPGQEAILKQLPKVGESNQIIATTESSFVEEVAPPGSVVDVSGRASAA